MADFKEILVLGVGRSGSNLLCSILRQIDGNAGFFEIFAEQRVEGLQWHAEIADLLADRLGVAVEDASGAELLAQRNADPAAFFDALSDAAASTGKTSVSCKIFAQQISTSSLEKLLQRRNLSVIFLTRRRIDRHISARKGVITRSYVKEDTTELKPHLDLSAFLDRSFEYDRQLEVMYRTVQASGVPHAILNYERDLDIAAETRLDRIGTVLDRIGHQDRIRKADADSWTVKQDQNADWRDKIDNGFVAASALAGLGLLDYAEEAPLVDLLPTPPASRAAEVAQFRDDDLLDEGGYFQAFSRDPVITFSAIQYDRSFLAEWMAGPAPAFGDRKGLHFLKPTWTMETSTLTALRSAIGRAEACNPGHVFVPMNVSDREAARYREVGLRTIAGNPNIFGDESSWTEDSEPHRDLVATDALYIARLESWKQHHLAADLARPLFVYADPDNPTARAQADEIRRICASAQFANHLLGRGSYHYLQRPELRQVMSLARVALALSSVEGCMRASAECLLAGLPIITVPSVGGRDLLFTPDTALEVDPTAQGVRAGVEAMVARRLSRAEVRRATLGRLREERFRFREAANRIVQAHLGPLAPTITIEPLLDFTIRYTTLRSMVEGLK